MKKTTPEAKKNLKKQRVMRYFIDAARKISKEEGLSGITIRSVADRAGYNSASLYNYFDNLEQLLAFTSIDLISDWLLEYIHIMEGEGDELDKYILGWEMFSMYSFNDPATFSYVYASENTDKVIQYFEEYQEIFPGPCDEIPEEVMEVYKKKTLREQEQQNIASCVKAGFFNEADAESVYMLALILNNGLLCELTNKKSNVKTHEEYTRIYIKYLVEYIQIKLQKPKDLSKYL